MGFFFKPLKIFIIVSEVPTNPNETKLQTAALNYKLIKKIKDERFDEDQIHQYHLLIHIGTRDLQVGVIDSRDDRMLLLEDYVFPSLSSHDDLTQVLEQTYCF